MPIYEYACEKCGKPLEVMQRITEDPLTECTVEISVESDAKDKKCEKVACGGKLKKLISQTSFSLKGGGWYKDGYS